LLADASLLLVGHFRLSAPGRGIGIVLLLHFALYLGYAFLRGGTP
jgi:hypothetical protein